MRNKTLLVVVAIVGIGAGIAIGYAIRGGDSYTFPSPPGIDDIQPSCAGRETVIFEDSFMLENENAPSDECIEWDEKWDQLADADPNWLLKTELPLSVCNYYFNKVFLQVDEDVEVILRSDAPVGLGDVGGECEYYAMVLLIGVGTDYNMSESALKRHGMTCELQRADGDWELTLRFKARATGDYFLWVDNDASGQVWCQYAVLLRD